MCSALNKMPKKNSRLQHCISEIIEAKKDDEDDDINSFGLLYYLIIANSNEYKKVDNLL